MKIHIILSLIVIQVAWLEAVPLNSKPIKVVDSKHHKGGVPYNDLETVGLNYQALKKLGLSPMGVIGKDLISNAALAKIGIYDHGGVFSITTKSLKKLGFKLSELRRAGLHSHEIHKGKNGVKGVSLPGLHRVKGHVRSAHKRPTKVRIGYLNKIGFTPRLLQLLHLTEKDIDLHGAVGLRTLQKNGIVFRGHNGYITLKALKELGLPLTSLRKLGINKKHIMNNSINIRILSVILGKNGKACNKNNSGIMQNNNSTSTEDQYVFNTTQYHVGDIFGCQGTGIAAAAKDIVHVIVLKVRGFFDIFPFLKQGPANHKAL